MMKELADDPLAAGLLQCRFVISRHALAHRCPYTNTHALNYLGAVSACLFSEVLVYGGMLRRVRGLSAEC